MNIENAKTLVGQLERLPDEKFDMGDWIHHTALKCGTVACIAGWCSILNGGPDQATHPIDVANFAKNFLGLQDTSLFCRSNWRDDDRNVAERPAAIAQLRREASRPD